MEMLTENGLISEEVKSIIENTNDLMFIKDRDFVYIAASRNFATGCARLNSVADVIGKTDFELFDDQEVAAGYRADDERLFASGRSMAEFQEEYPDGKGNKIMCLTTKYILHDKDGKPAAIFGQYHDIGELMEEEIGRRRDINRNVAAALSESLFAANYVDLKSRKYVTVCAMDYAKNLLDGCETAEEAFNTFIKELVKPEYQKKMREFCNVDTIAERLKGRREIDCEYLSNASAGWCKASFLPCEWDENNEVTHALFAVSPIDENIALEIEENISNRKDLKTISNVAPAGIVVYKWVDGKLTFLSTNGYYRDLFGYDTVKEGDEPSYSRIHPGDVNGYNEAISKALTTAERQEYVFRSWNKEKMRYCWLQINATAKSQTDGTALVYAIFTDITDQKDAELEVKKRQASLEAALNAANQLCCEYDPVEHSIDCFTESNFFNLTTHMHNYPECLRDIDFIHPDDIELFIETVHSTDDGQNSAHCDVRAKRDGEYRWFACRFEPYYDEEKERNVIILTIIDATVRITSIQSYRERMHALEKANADALCMCDVNLTKNVFSNVQARAIIKRCGEKAETLEEFMMLASEAVFDPEEQREYRALFRRDELLRRFEKGESHIQLEHYYRIDGNNTALVATVFDLMKEPVTDEVVGICYARDLNTARMSTILLNASLEKDYPMAALVYADTDEYYLYEIEAGEYCTHKQNYWKAVHDRLANSVGEQELEDIRSNLTGQNVISYLEEHEEYSYTFYGLYHGTKCRLETKFRYVDRKHHLMLATLRNITDENLYEQYKYESEHDPLTGMYNRNTVFAKCREMINNYPNEEFVMMHIDVRHFHLYNTFFGEEGGNQLLCGIAEVLNRMGSEYDIFAQGRIEADVFCVFFPVNRGLFEGHVRRSFEELEAFSPDFPLDLAIGAYWVVDRKMPIEAMFTRATIAAKSHKKNLFGLIARFDDEMDQALQDAQQITSEMTAAIEQEQFEVYLQPKYALRSDRMVGAEALVRWNHPERGMISPGKFIPAFERNGFIAELDRYMWEHVCQILRNWQDEGKPMYPVSVNISRVSMYSHLTVPFLKSLIEKYDIEPKYLELELTETAYMDDPEDLKRMLKELQEFGFRILMDDFGSGYSSLNTLRDLPVDVLKLDMKFLSKTQEDIRSQAVLSSVVRMSKLLNLPIVAEGVEEQEQADYLRSIGCEYVQGFLYARPMPMPEYEKLLAEADGEKSIDYLPNKDIASLTSTNMTVENLNVPICVLEYKSDYFAYLRANKTFMQEFNLVDNIRPASKVFREHVDDTNYAVLLQAFANCSESGRASHFSLDWIEDNGIIRKYYGYAQYSGKIGNYSELLVSFVNVTESKIIIGHEHESDQTGAMVQALDNTGIHMFMYYPQTKTITVPEKTCEAYQCKAFYDNMPHSFADDYVHEDDYPEFKEMYYKIDRGAKTATALFHSKDLNYCNNVTLTTVSWLDNGEPDEVFGLIEDKSDLFKNKNLVSQLKEELATQNENEELDEALKVMAASIGTQYFAVYYIWLESHTYVCFQEQLEGILSLIGEKGQYEPAWDIYINNCIDERDQRGIREFIDITTLADRINSKNSISYVYRRKEIGWTRGMFIVGKRDDSGKPLTVIYTVSDINEEIETKQKKQQAELESLRDPLTKLWNRKAFEQFQTDRDYTDNQTGILLFDIDRFKGINDQYGHDIGDQVIQTVAQAVRGVMRQKDLIFRMGGDEFAVLLYNCNTSIWNTTCRKIETIHADLRSNLPAELQVSISAGFCVSENGYFDGMYKLADQAMFNTKANGRGGCTLVDLNGAVVKEWHDQSGVLRKGEVLEKNSTVTWRLDKAKKEGLPGRVYGDELFCAFVGMDRTAQPEELYKAWEERVEPDNFDIIREAARLAIADGKVEVVFAWRHPEKGVIQLRCSGSLEGETEDYYTFIGYIHVITGTHVVTMDGIDSMIKDALEEMYFANFYIRLSDYSFKVYKAQSYMMDMLGSSKTAIDAVNSYINYMVAEESKESMAAFLDLTTLKQRLKDVNYLRASYNDPNIGWSQAKFAVVNRNESGEAENVALVVEAIQ